VKKLRYMPNERASPPLVEKEAVIPVHSIDLDQIVIDPSRLSAARVTRVGLLCLSNGKALKGIPEFSSPSLVSYSS
jgi:hypothetical protein